MDAEGDASMNVAEFSVAFKADPDQQGGHDWLQLQDVSRPSVCLFACLPACLSLYVFLKH